MDSTNVFDTELYPDLDAVRDRHSIRPDNERVYFPEGSFAQGTDVNEAFSIEADKRKAIGDLIASDGDRLAGGDIVVDVDAGTVFIAAGEVYLIGGRRAVAAKTLTSVPMTGDVQLGIRAVTTPITADDDAVYLGLYPAAVESYGEPGGVRTVISVSWAFATDGQPGDFYPYVIMRNGAVVSQDAPPTLSGIQQQLATYDYDAHENYVVRGCNVIALGLGSQGQTFSIAEGVANVMGFKTTRPSATRFFKAEDPDIGEVDAEPHTFDTAGTTVFTVRRTPIAAVSSVIITKQRTVTITKGVTGSLDTLPDDSVTSVISVVQGGTTYVTPTSYSQSGDAIQWTPGGAQPTTGSSYQVTYQYLDAVVPDSQTAATITASGGVTGSPAFLHYSFKLPRIDKVCLDQNGNVVYLKGLSAQVQPQPPQVPLTILALADVQNNWFDTPTVVNNGIHAYPFPLIDRMYNKLIDLLNLVTLQKQALDINIRSAGSATGTFSDPLTSDYYRDAGETQNGAVFNGSFQIPIVPTFQTILMADVAMLDYTDETVISQPLISGCVAVNPYQVFSPLPAVLVLTPAEDFWTETQTVYLSAQTAVFGSGNTERVVDTETLTSTKSSDIAYLRQISVAFTISDFGRGEILSKLLFNDVDVTPLGLVANSQGIITGAFVIPAKTPSGTKLVVATGGSGATCAAYFTGQGLLEVTSVQQVTTVQRYQVDTVTRTLPVSGSRRGGPDPQAQGFAFIDGRHVSSLDIKFCRIGSRSEPVIVEFVTMENGYPTTTVIAQTEVDMTTVIANQWTNFAFDVPFYLPSNQLFAFIIKTNDPVHSISIADRGQFDAANQQWIAAQPYTVGTRFDSSNAETWTAHQDSDITFRLNCADFNPTTKTISLGVFAVTNCSDLIIRGDIFLPTDATKVYFNVTFGTEAVVQVLPDQVLERSSFFTGNVKIDMVMVGAEYVSPVIQKAILAIFGTMQANGVYISNAWAMGTAVKVDCVASIKLPTGSTLTVECDATDDSWQSMPATTGVAIDDGYTEQTYEKASFTAPKGRLRLTLTGTPAARPTVTDLRGFTI